MEKLEIEISQLKDLVTRLQWEIRNAYYLGYEAAKPDQDRSKLNPEKKEWFDHWVLSKPRAMLVNWGIISPNDTYR